MSLCNLIVSPVFTNQVVAIEVGDGNIVVGLTVVLTAGFLACTQRYQGIHSHSDIEQCSASPKVRRFL